MTGKSRLFASVAGVALMATAYEASPAMAQQLAVEEIIVTARKRAESIQDAPVAITAFSAVDIQNAGFTNILDVTKAAPGVFVESFNVTPARIDTTPRFRGIFLSTGNPLQQTAGIFIDGNPVIGGIQGIGVQELERVEIVKGPQSALFGRNTFAGAINYVTKDPGDEFRSDISVLGATRDEYRASGSVEGPITDTVKARLNTSYDFNGGHYDNNAVPQGQELGETSTFSISGVVTFEPAETFRAKVRAHYYEDRDGPPASENVTGVNFHNFGGFPIDPVTGNADTSSPFDGPGIRGLETESVFAGKILAPDESTIGSNTGPDDIAQFVSVFSNDGRSGAVVWPSSFNIDDNDEFGLKRNAFRLSGQFEFDVTDNTTFTINAAYNTEDTGLWTDFDQTGDQSFLSFQSRKIEDKSVEARFAGLSFDDKLAWTLGGNYVKIDIDSLGGTMNQRGFPFFFTAAFDPIVHTGAETKSFFGSFDYQITDQLAIIAEGRYQWDEITEDSVNNGLATPISPATIKKFLPRVVIEFEPNDDTLFYANYSQGNLPGGFNPQVGALDPAALAELVALAPGAKVTFGEEKLVNYELGWKQTALDSRLAVNLATFYMKRSDEIFRSIEVVTDNRPGAPNPLRTVAFNANGATTNIYGLELDAAFNITESFSVAGSLAYIDAKIASFPPGEGSGDFGDIFGPQADVKGQQAPRFPPWSGSINATYDHALSGNGTLGGMFDSWYTRADVFYTGTYFSSNANVASTKGAFDVNMRTGLRAENMSVEFFVTNLFDDDTPTAVFNFADVSEDTRGRPGENFNFTREANTVGLRDKRQFGVRVNYSF